MAEDIAVKVAEIEQRSKSNTHRLDKVEERQDNLDKLVSSVEVLATRQETVETDVKEIKTDVKALAEKPAKRWTVSWTSSFGWPSRALWDSLRHRS